MVFGLLHGRIKKRLIRENFRDFNKLLSQVRALEVALRPSGSVSPTFIGKLQEVSLTGAIPKVQCKCCGAIGRVGDECKKLQKKRSRSSTGGTSHPKGSDPYLVSKKQFACFGGSAEGIIRFKCKNCSGPKTLQFWEPSKLQAKRQNVQIVCV